MIKNLLAERGRLPRRGVIRLGIKVKSRDGTKDVPREVPWFVVPDELLAICGPRPTALPVLFPVEDPERVFDCWMTRYDGQTIGVKCDGENARCWDKAGAVDVVPCARPPVAAGEAIRLACPRKCKPVGRLNVIVLDAPLGIYQVVIGGEQRITDLMMALELARATAGRLTGLVFTLRRVETIVQILTPTGRIPKKGWPVVLVPPFTAAQALAASGRDIADPMLRQRDALPTFPPAAQAMLEAIHEPPSDGDGDEEAGLDVHDDVAEDAAEVAPVGPCGPNPELAAPESSIPVGTRSPRDISGGVSMQQLRAFGRLFHDEAGLGPLVKKAAALGLTENGYRLYIQAVFPEGMTEANVTDQHAAFDGVTTPEAHSALRAAIIAKVNAALRKGNG